MTYSEAVPSNGVAVKRIGSRERKITMLIAFAHLPLGVLLYNVGPLAILHPVAIFLLGLYWAVKERYSLNRVALAAGYIIGAEVLWRMAHVPIPWEFGKYGSAAIMIIALLTRLRLNIPKLPLVYLFALIPACIITLTAYYPEEARWSRLIFGMSGPVFLAISCWFFSHVRINVPQLRRLFLAIIIPLLSVGCVTLFYTVTVENLDFDTESNLATSGGFGPNQVSAMLGLGLFLTLGCIILFKNSSRGKALLGTIAVFFAAQSMMTFSRGGIYAAVGAGIVLILFHFHNLADGIKRLLPILVLVALFVLFVFPFINNFTGGKLLERFEDEGTTKRVDIIESDVQIFLENPVFGLGVGFSSNYRKRFLQYTAASHTEFSRMLSEHGSLGILAIACLIAMTVLNVLRQRSILGRALIAGVSVWSILFMFNAGMRMGAPSFIWGMAFLTLVNGRLILRAKRPYLRNSLGPIAASEGKTQLKNS